MTFDAAVIKEQGVTFSVVVVKSSALNSSNKERVRDDYSRYFPRMPIILMAQDSRGIPTYDGRKDIVQFLANLHISQIPFKRYTV